LGLVAVESRGRVVIPVEIRRALGIKEGSFLEVTLEDGKIVMRPVRKMSALDLYGLAGSEEVDLKEVEEGLGEEG